MDGKEFKGRVEGRELTILDRKDWNVVEEYKVGNTTVKICDNCCRDKTPEDEKKIIQNIARIALDSYQRQAAEMEAKAS